jgi:hypothetical protein
LPIRPKRNQGARTPAHVRVQICPFQARPPAGSASASGKRDNPNIPVGPFIACAPERESHRRNRERLRHVSFWQDTTFACAFENLSLRLKQAPGSVARRIHIDAMVVRAQRSKAKKHCARSMA